MGLSSYFVTSPRMCFSTEEYNEWMNDYYNKNDDDDENTIAKWFFYLIATNVKDIESF